MSQSNNFFAAFPPFPVSPFYGRALAYIPGLNERVRIPANTVLGTRGGEGPKDSVFMVLDPENDVPDQLANAVEHGYQFVELAMPSGYRLGGFMELLTHMHGLGVGAVARNAARSAGPYQYLAHPNVFGCVVERQHGSPLEYAKLRHDVRKDGLMPVWFVFDGADGADGAAEEIRLHDLKGMGVTFSSGLTCVRYDDSHSVLTPLP